MFKPSSLLIALVIFCQFLAIFLVQCTPPVDEKAKKIETAIEAVQQEFAPDRRTARFDVALKPGEEGYIIEGQTTNRRAKEQFLQLLAGIDSTIQTDIAVLPDEALGDRTYGFAKNSVCNVRSEPRHAAELATQAVMGMPLRVLKKEGDWWLIQTHDLYLGWLYDGGLHLVDQKTFEAWKKRQKVVFQQERGFLYENPTETTILSDLVPGSILLSAAERTGSHEEVELIDGRKGFVRRSQVMPFEYWAKAPLPSTEELIATAQKFMGRPYLWGGTSSYGIDCSGYTKSIFYHHGYILPRDASQQVPVGVEVPSDTTWQGLEQGDFLFFGQPATEGKKEKITHVAIYLGAGKIIHATGRVKIESLNPGDPDFAQERYQTFVRAKRMLGDPAETGVLPVSGSPFYGS